MNNQNALCKDTVTHSESHMTRAQWICSEAEKSAIFAIVKRLGIISKSGTRQVLIKKLINLKKKRKTNKMKVVCVVAGCCRY